MFHAGVGRLDGQTDHPFASDSCPFHSGLRAGNQDHGFDIVHPRESSTLYRYVAVLGQPERIERANIELYVSVAGDRTVLKAIILIEVAETDDAGIAVTRARPSAVVDHETSIERVMGRVVLQVNSVPVARAVLDPYGIEGVPARGDGLEGPPISAAGIHRDMVELTVGDRIQPESEGAAAQAPRTCPGILIGNGHFVNAHVSANK